MNTAKLVLALLDEAYERKTWHGPNLKQSLKGISVVQAAWRPGAERHNIWEEALHAAYWKYAVRRRLVGDKRGSFHFKGSNWFSRPDEPSPAAWEQDVALLVAEHKRLVEVARAIDPRRLHEPAKGTRQTPATLLRGIAFHDIYHAGQIQLLKRL